MGEVPCGSSVGQCRAALSRRERAPRTKAGGPRRARVAELGCKVLRGAPAPENEAGGQDYEERTADAGCGVTGPR